jgi:hypothetical protein
LHWALVIDVKHPVLIVIEVRAAVEVFKGVLVLWLARAFVIAIQDPIAVLILNCVRATVMVVYAVIILWLVWAQVFRV